MKPPPFDYRDPATLEETLGLLASYGRTPGPSQAGRASSRC